MTDVEVRTAAILAQIERRIARRKELADLEDCSEMGGTTRRMMHLVEAETLQTLLEDLRCDWA